MRRLPSRSPDAAAFALAAIVSLGAPAKALAQACCAGSTAVTPGRLSIHEDALVGVLASAAMQYGQFYGDGTFVHQKWGSEVDLQQEIFATARVLGKGQISLIAPLVETYRRESGISDLGGGFGDLQASARWDFTLAGASVRVPGIAAIATLTLPTGVPPEEATDPLASDSTGTGAFQGAFAVALEQTWGKLLVNLTGSVTAHSARTEEGIHSQLGPAFNAFAAVAWTFDAGPAAALTLSYTGEPSTWIDGVAQPQSGRRQLRVGVSGGSELPGGWRVQASVFMDPPIPGLGENEPTDAGLTTTVISTW